MQYKEMKVVFPNFQDNAMRWEDIKTANIYAPLNRHEVFIEIL